MKYDGIGSDFEFKLTYIRNQSPYFVNKSKMFINNMKGYYWFIWYNILRNQVYKIIKFVQQSCVKVVWSMTAINVIADFSLIIVFPWTQIK